MAASRGLALDDLLRLAAEHSEAYASAHPFPHAVFDGLFEDEHLHRVVEELPSPDEAGWTTWDTSNEWKYVFDRPERFGPAARALADRLNSSEFLRFLECLTGIDGLIPDPHLTAASYSDVRRGGFLNVHLDFARNPKLSLVRRVNVLVYLNEGWQETWGGELELWRAIEDGPAVRISPVFNRMVVFSTPGAVHGHPRPVSAPAGRRLCFSAYYFTSPDQLGPPAGLHGVLFGERPTRRRVAAAATKLLPPIVVGAYRSGRRLYRGRASASRPAGRPTGS